MKTITITRAIVKNPPVLLPDEPIKDPDSRNI
jgi:ABC-type ATPase involved in cell division